jgi:hypothetical protein
MDDFEVEKLKHEIGLKLLMKKAMADERSIFQSDSEEVKQIRSFLETAQLGAYAAKIEQ